MGDELISSHAYEGDLIAGASCQYVYRTTYEGHPLKELEVCARQAMEHAWPVKDVSDMLVTTHPHLYVEPNGPGDHCAFYVKVPRPGYRQAGTLVCGWPRQAHPRPKLGGQLVRAADVAQYAREPMPDRARAGITVTLIDAPVDPLGTLAVLTGIYEGKVRRSKTEVTDVERREAYDAMMATVLAGPLESVQFTFLVEGVSRAITHQMVRNRFAFYAQESLRFAVAEDWAQEVPLPPSLAGLAEDDPRVGVWRKGLNAAEDSYAALVGAGVPAEEARGLLPHAITTRLFWTVSLRTLLMEAGKRTCTQAQFDWRVLFGGVAKAFRERAREEAGYMRTLGGNDVDSEDGWQYELFAGAIRPVCYQQGKCGFMAKFDRGCTIRSRVDQYERAGIPSSEWDKGSLMPLIGAINPREWAADPAAARITEEG
jgi:flavin-dependent thymidylate synthase